MFFLLAITLSVDPAGAVVIDTGDGSGNISNPADDPGWDAVGRAGGLTGVYVGDRWVLTAHHVVAGTEPQFTIGGVVYEPVLDSTIQFDTGGTGADLALYRIIGRPNAPEVLLSETPPIADVEDVTMIGKGWTRETTETTWTSSWTETPPGATAFTGSKRLSSGVMRWGRNRVTISGVDLTIGSRTTRSFHTEFDAAGGLADEAQAVTGDSGGAAFVTATSPVDPSGSTENSTSTQPSRPARSAVVGYRGLALKRGTDSSGSG